MIQKQEGCTVRAVQSETSGLRAQQSRGTADIATTYFRSPVIAGVPRVESQVPDSVPYNSNTMEPGAIKRPQELCTDGHVWTAWTTETVTYQWNGPESKLETHRLVRRCLACGKEMLG